MKPSACSSLACAVSHRLESRHSSSYGLFEPHSLGAAKLRDGQIPTIFIHSTKHLSLMTTRPASTFSPPTTFSPPPLLHTRSSPSVNQQFPTLRPPLQTTPTRDGRSRSTNQINGSSTPSKPESMTYDTFYDVLSHRYCPAYSLS
jgi:hypothetical protein